MRSAGERRSESRLRALGVACALGCEAEAVWTRLRAADLSGMGERDDLVRGERRPFGSVPDPLPPIPETLAPFDCRNNRLALAALAPLWPDLEEAKARWGAERVGVVVGSSTSGVAEAERALRVHGETGSVPPEFDLAQLEYGGLSEFLHVASGAGGPGFALSTACSTGAKALVSARGLLDLGLCDAVLCGAVDTLCGLTANGFHALQALAPTLTNPMSAHREGLSLGEAGALFLLTRERGGVQLVGAGESSDAHHISAPEPEGRGAEKAMRAALADAGLAPESVHYLNLHGTGTPQNDAMESAAVARVFPKGIPCSSTKPTVGHTLGASGALEAAFCWLALTHLEDGGLPAPPHAYDGQPDPEIPALDLVETGRVVAVEGPARVMTNSFGFGGSNCTLVLERDPA